MKKDKIERNDICPCGSGKKYKKCCSLKEEQHNYSSSHLMDVEWQKIRKTEGEVVDKFLLPYVFETFDKDVMLEAWSDFIDENINIPEDDLEVVHEYMFIPWFLFNWLPYDEEFAEKYNINKTIAEIFLTTKLAKNLTSLQRQFIEEMPKTFYSFYVVLDVVKDHSVVVKDMILGIEYMIKERSGTKFLQRGNIIFSRVLNMQQQSIFVGMAPFIVPSRYHPDILDLQDSLIEEFGDPLTISVLRDDVEMDLRDQFFDMIEESFNPEMPVLYNSDGDILEHCSVEFSLLVPIEDTLDRLILLSGESAKENILSQAKYNKSGSIKHITIPWVKSSTEDLNKLQTTSKKISGKSIVLKTQLLGYDDSNIVMGDIIIEPRKLRVEANSKKRAGEAIVVITKNLGDDVKYITMNVSSLEDMMASRGTEKNLAKSIGLSKDMTPELKDALDIMIQNHWNKWFDEKIPMLNNQTPNEAAKTVAGKKRLEALLLHYEANSNNDDDNLCKPDIQYLREKLGL